jgi:hypothetical protein
MSSKYKIQDNLNAQAYSRPDAKIPPPIRIRSFMHDERFGAKPCPYNHAYEPDNGNDFSPE